MPSKGIVLRHCLLCLHPYLLPKKEVEMIRTRVSNRVLSAVRGSEGVARGARSREFGSVELMSAAPLRPLAGPSTSNAQRTFSSKTAPAALRTPRSALAPRSLLFARGYAAEAGGKFSRSKPHFK